MFTQCRPEFWEWACERMATEHNIYSPGDAVDGGKPQPCSAQTLSPTLTPNPADSFEVIFKRLWPLRHLWMPQPEGETALAETALPIPDSALPAPQVVHPRHSFLQPGFI